ncbi:hypothetical protein FOL47_000503 [Perkinsus chesapeaki]|uniref:Uncharacterized protein n=1 Tax=Perkinsus chesapeaki TaxID=330153 RepID=A0A7J6MLR6_PERCH|nr:hypothetical protein FOL47_000503 [Perkinsus chesapeaki]
MASFVSTFVALIICVSMLTLIRADSLAENATWTDEKATLLHQGRMRSFWIYSGPVKPTAVIFTLIGWDPKENRCDLWHMFLLDLDGIKKRAREQGATLVTACPLESPRSDSSTSNISGWGYNAGTCCNSNKTIDDIDFIRKLIVEVESRQSVTNLPAYAIGFSNGGMLAEALVCYNVISMAASVAGILTLRPGLDGGFDKCDSVFNHSANKQMGIIKIHGLDDPKMPYNGRFDPKLGPVYPSVESDISRWAKRMECPDAQRVHFDQRGNGTFEKYSDCPRARNVYLTTVKGLAHTWPLENGPGGFSAGKAIFEYFGGVLGPSPTP